MLLMWIHFFFDCVQTQAWIKKNFPKSCNVLKPRSETHGWAGDGLRRQRIMKINFRDDCTCNVLCAMMWATTIAWENSKKNISKAQVYHKKKDLHGRFHRFNNNSKVAQEPLFFLIKIKTRVTETNSRKRCKKNNVQRE